MVIELRGALRFLCLIVLIVLPSAYSDAQPVLIQERFSFSPDVPKNTSIPSPESILGYELGEAVTLYSDVVGYLETLSANSNRVRMFEYGRTYEDRPLYYLIITSQSNFERLDNIKANNALLASGPDASNSEIDSVIESQPIVVWLSYNVHGNEASSTEAAMQVAYYFAAAEDRATMNLLDQAVVILDPCINPDGRDRYAYWYRSMASSVLNTDPLDVEHDEPWPGGRTNHYWFDLNRDWVWLVHPESRGRIKIYQEWLPQVHMDYHEQGFNNNYFTMPGTTPRNLNLPEDYDKWAFTFGKDNASVFDQNLISYATSESFDFFYPGYGSSYPSNLGAIGMLAEQGGHSRGGRAVETSDGYLLTLRQRIFDHYLTSLSTVQTAVDNRLELLQYFRTFFSQQTQKSRTKAYVFADDQGRGYAYDVVALMLKHGITVERLQQGVDVEDAYSYWDGKPRPRTVDRGAYVIKTNQPRHVLINTLFQRRMVIEDSVMYDMATWSIPLAYNLDAFWTENEMRGSTEIVTEPPAPAAAVINPEAAYAYVIDWDQKNAPRALSALWEAGYSVRVARKPFKEAGQSFPEGSIVLLLGRNLEKTASVQLDILRISRECQVEIVGLDSGRMDEGIDLASQNVRPLKKPSVAMLIEQPFSSYTAGQIWFLFDQWTGFGISRYRADRFSSLDLSDLDVLILPAGGRFDGLRDSADVARLKGWVQRGGTLVATEGSALALTKEVSGFTPVTRTPAVASKEEDSQTQLDPAVYTMFEARSDSSGLRRIPGSAFKGHVDTSHPLAFGVSDRMFSLRFSTEALEPSTNLHAVGYYDTDPDELLVAGYASKENLQKLAGQVFAGVQPMGQGNVVFLVDNTQYRMFWVGSSRLLQNAVLLVPGAL